MTPILVIPARMASTRLPGKPLADIAGRAMILRVCDVAAAAQLGPVVVAAAEAEIVDAVRAGGHEAVLTDPALPSGSDRVKAALDIVDPGNSHDIVVNLQGDMPTLAGDALCRVLQPLMSAPACAIATLASEITDPAEADDRNVVKAVFSPGPSGSGRALYFSRAAVPAGAGPLWHHVGVYAFRRPALERFVAAPPSPLEQRERLEQLRALELGLRIDVARIDGPPPNGVDTPEDLEAARRHFA